MFTNRVAFKSLKSCFSPFMHGTLKPIWPRFRGGSRLASKRNWFTGSYFFNSLGAEKLFSAYQSYYNVESRAAPTSPNL
jgi:hypothetical protein